METSTNTHHLKPQDENSNATSSSEIVGVLENTRESSASQCLGDDVDLESGVLENNKEVHLKSDESDKDCRICHMSLDSSNQESGGVCIELGCSCKDDLAAAHKHCAEAWFKIKGNK